LPATALVAIASSFAYLFAFLYLCGYANYFGIPPEFISVNLISVFIAMGICLALSLGPQSATRLIRMFFPHKIHPVLAWRMNTSFYAFFLFLCFVYLFDASFSYLGPGLVVLIIVTFFLFVFPLITQRKYNGYLKKLVKQDEFDAFWDTKSDLGPSRIVLSQPIYRLVIEGIVFLVIAYLVGRSVAFHKTEFLTNPQQPAIVVLAIYPDKIITGEVDLKTRSLLHRYWILPVTATVSTGWEKRKIGRLAIASPVQIRI
jgi:hypothetical protein